MSTENDLEDFLAPGCSGETNSVLPLSPKPHSSGSESIDDALMEAMDSIIERKKYKMWVYEYWGLRRLNKKNFPPVSKEWQLNRIRGVQMINAERRLRYSKRTTNDITPNKRRRKSTGTGIGAKSPKSAKEGKEEMYISAQIGLLCEISLHVSKDKPIAVQCDSCDKWRHLHDVEEDFEVPKVWFCWQNTDTSHKTCSTEEEMIPGNEYCMSPFQPGSIVWARVAGYPSWPAMIEDDPECLQFYEKEDVKNGEKFTKYHVTFFDDTVTMAWVPVRNVKRFLKTTEVPKLSSKYRNRYGTRFNKAVNEANKAMDMLLTKRLLKYSFAVRHKGEWGLVPTSIVDFNIDGVQSTLDETKLMNVIESLPDDLQTLKDDLKNDARKNGLIVKISVSKGKKRKKMLKDDDDYGHEIFGKMDTGAYDVGGQDDVEKRKTDVLSNGVNVEERKDAEADKMKNAMKGKKVKVVSEVAEMAKIVKKEKNLKTEDTDSKRSHVDKKSLTSKFSLTKREKKMLEKDIGAVHLNHETKTNHDDEVYELRSELCGEKFQDESRGIFEETNTEVYNGGQEKVDKQMGKTGSDVNVEKEESAGAGKVTITMEWKKDNVVSSVAKVGKTAKNKKKIENVGKKDLTFKPSVEKVETDVWQAKETKKKRGKKANKAKEETDMNMEIAKVIRAMKKDVESEVIKMEKASNKDGKQEIKSSINEEAVDMMDAKVNKEKSLEEKSEMNDKDHGRFTTKNFKTVICPTSPLKVDTGTKEKVIPEFPRRNKLFKPPVIKLDVDTPLNDSEKKPPIAAQPSEISSTEPSANNNGLGANGIGLCYPDHVDIMSWDAITKVLVNGGIVQKPSDEPILIKEPPFAVHEDTGFHFGDTEDVFFYGEGKKEMRMIDDVCNDPGDKELMDFDASPMIEAGVNSDPFDYD